MKREYTGHSFSLMPTLRAQLYWANLCVATTYSIVNTARDITSEAIQRCPWLSAGTSSRSGRDTLVPRSEPYKGPDSMNWWGEN